MSNQDKAASARLQKQRGERKDRRAAREILKSTSGRFDIESLKDASYDDRLMDQKK